MSFFSDTQNNRDEHQEKCGHYKYTFPDGSGAVRYNGAPLEKGDSSESDHHTLYWDEMAQKMMPIPAGYTAPGYDDPDEKD